MAEGKCAASGVDIDQIWSLNIVGALRIRIPVLCTLDFKVASHVESRF